MLSCLSIPLNSVRREFAPLTETDAYQPDASAPLTSRHADLIIAWPTVEGEFIFNISVIYFMYAYVLCILVTVYNHVTKLKAPSIKNRLGSAIVAGFSAARDTRRGTPFVRAIHDVFRAHAKSDDILSLLTRVRTISFSF